MAVINSNTQAPQHFNQLTPSQYCLRWLGSCERKSMSRVSGVTGQVCSSAQQNVKALRGFTVIPELYICWRMTRLFEPMLHLPAEESEVCWVCACQYSLRYQLYLKSYWWLGNQCLYVHFRNQITSVGFHSTLKIFYLWFKSLILGREEIRLLTCM